MFHNVPAEIACDLGADKIIAVDVGHSIRKGRLNNLFGIFIQAWHLREKELSRYQDLHAEILIKVSLSDISPIDFHQGKRCI